jgi:hypothetical protein
LGQKGNDDGLKFLTQLFHPIAGLRPRPFSRRFSMEGAALDVMHDAASNAAIESFILTAEDGRGYFEVNIYQ